MYQVGNLCQVYVATPHKTCVQICQILAHSKLIIGFLTMASLACIVFLYVICES